jgi:hypothetical protein
MISEGTRTFLDVILVMFQFVIIIIATMSREKILSSFTYLNQINENWNKNPLSNVFISPKKCNNDLFGFNFNYNSTTSNLGFNNIEGDRDKKNINQLNDTNKANNGMKNKDPLDSNTIQNNYYDSLKKFTKKFYSTKNSIIFNKGNQLNCHNDLINDFTEFTDEIADIDSTNVDFEDSKGRELFNDQHFMNIGKLFNSDKFICNKDLKSENTNPLINYQFYNNKTDTEDDINYKFEKNLQNSQMINYSYYKIKKNSNCTNPDFNFCGILDTLGTKLCLKECPANYLEILFNSEKNSISEEDLASGKQLYEINSQNSNNYENKLQSKQEMLQKEIKNKESSIYNNLNSNSTQIKTNEQLNNPDTKILSKIELNNFLLLVAGFIKYDKNNISSKINEIIVDVNILKQNDIPIYSCNQNNNINLNTNTNKTQNNKVSRKRKIKNTHLDLEKLNKNALHKNFGFSEINTISFVQSKSLPNSIVEEEIQKYSILKNNKKSKLFSRNPIKPDLKDLRIRIEYKEENLEDTIFNSQKNIITRLQKNSNYIPLYKTDTRPFVGWSDNCTNDPKLNLLSFSQFISDFNFFEERSYLIHVACTVFGSFFIFIMVINKQFYFKYYDSSKHTFVLLSNLLLVFITINSLMYCISKTWNISYLMDDKENFTICSDNFTNDRILQAMKNANSLLWGYSVLFFIMNLNWCIPLWIVVYSNTRNTDELDNKDSDNVNEDINQ